LTQQPSQSEVGDLRPALAIEQDVFRFDVAMHNAQLVGAFQRFAELGDNGQRFARRETAIGNHVAQGGSLDKLHEQKVQIAHLAEIMNRYDVRMVQSGQGAGLAREPLGK